MKLVWLNPGDVPFHKLVLFHSAFKFCLKYFKLKSKDKIVQIEFVKDCGLKTNEDFTTYGYMAELVDGKGYGVVIKHRSIRGMLYTIFHEMAHVDQMHRGRFQWPQFSFPTWFYVPYVNWVPMTSELHNERYYDYPWEVEAREYETKLMEAWKKSWLGLRRNYE